MVFHRFCNADELYLSTYLSPCVVPAFEGNTLKWIVECALSSFKQFTAVLPFLVHRTSCSSTRSFAMAMLQLPRFTPSPTTICHKIMHRMHIRARLGHISRATAQQVGLENNRCHVDATPQYQPRPRMQATERQYNGIAAATAAQQVGVLKGRLASPPSLCESAASPSCPHSS